MADIPRREKLTARLDVPIGEDRREKLSALAVINGHGSTAEYVRDVLTRMVYGELSMLQQYRRQRPDAMGGSSNE